MMWLQNAFLGGRLFCGKGELGARLNSWSELELLGDGTRYFHPPAACASPPRRARAVRLQRWIDWGNLRPILATSIGAERTRNLVLVQGIQRHQHPKAKVNNRCEPKYK
jgi:hypothetical protein